MISSCFILGRTRNQARSDSAPWFRVPGLLGKESLSETLLGVRFLIPNWARFSRGPCFRVPSRPAEVLWRHCCQPSMGGQQRRRLPPGPNLKPLPLTYAPLAMIRISDTNSRYYRFPDISWDGKGRDSGGLARFRSPRHALTCVNWLRLNASLRSRVHGSELSSARLGSARCGSARFDSPHHTSPSLVSLCHA